MKKSELFRQAYCSGQSAGCYFCIGEDGSILWMNSAAAEEFPRLQGGSVSSVCPVFEKTRPEDGSILPLIGGKAVRLSRFTEEDGAVFYIAGLTESVLPDGDYVPEYAASMVVQMREKLDRIRSLVSGVSDELSNLQADYLGTVPHLAGKLDRGLAWLKGAENDCDGLTRHILQFEDNFYRSDEECRGATDLGSFLPLFFRDIELELKNKDIPLEIRCDWNAVKAGCCTGVSQVRLAMALAGLVRVAAVNAVQKGGGSYSVQGRSVEGAFLFRIRDDGTDPAEMDRWENRELWGGEKVPTPANLAGGNVGRLMDAVGGSRMISRTPGEPGYTMTLRFPLLAADAKVPVDCGLGSSAAYRLDSLDYGYGGRWPAGLSGQKDLIRVMLSSLEDDFR